MFLAHDVNRQMGHIEVFQLHVADVIGVGNLHSIGVALAVRPGFGAVSGFGFNGLCQGILLLKEHGKVALHVAQRIDALMQRRQDGSQHIGVMTDGNWIFPFSQLTLGIYFHL